MFRVVCLRTSPSLYHFQAVTATFKQKIVTELDGWSGLQVCRLHNGNTVVYGPKLLDTDRGPGYYVYDSEGTKRKRLEEICEHKGKAKGAILSIVLENGENLVIQCIFCKKIYCLCLDSGKFYLSYENASVEFGPLFPGEPSKLYLVAKKSTQKCVSVYALVSASRTFPAKKSFHTKVTEPVCRAAFSMENNSFLLHGRQCVYVVSIKTGETVWKVESPTRTEPTCLTVFSKTVEKDNCEFLLFSNDSDAMQVMSTRDGRRLKAVKLLEGEGGGVAVSVLSVRCLGDLLVAHTLTQNGAVAVMLYTLNVTSESKA